MRSLTIILVAVTLCAIMAPALAGKGKGGKGGKGGRGMGMFKKCDGEDMVEEEAKKGMKECFKKPEKKGGEGGERKRRSPHGGEGGGKGKKGWKWMKNTCAFVCQWKMTGVLVNDTGAFDEAGSTSFVNKAYPEKARSAMIEAFKKCGADHGSKFSMDDNCGGYNDFKKCVFEAHKTTCKLPDWKGKGKGGGGGGSGGDPPPPPEDAQEEEE